jgi:retron-type reverse transcriptase
MTPGQDNITLDGIKSEDIERTHLKLKTRTHTYGTARRVNIPKPGKPGQTRSLTITPPRDKIIQQAFKRILEVIYEGIETRKQVDLTEFKAHPVGYGRKFTRQSKTEKKYYVMEEILPRVFSSKSHGFRKGRSCHTALKDIKHS